MKIVLLAAGKGQRFLDDPECDYPVKPLIEIEGIPMWEYVLNNFTSQFDKEKFDVCVVTKEEYGIKHENVINLVGPQYGAAFSAYEALKNSQNCEEELLILNVDQLITFNDYDFLDIKYCKPAGILFHFIEKERKYGWGRSVIDSPGYINTLGHMEANVDAIVEKIPVSPYAHTGHYYFRRTGDFLHYAKKLMDLNIKVLDEYFLSPIYNLMIADGLWIAPFFVDTFEPLGTPEELRAYQAKLKGEKNAV